MKVCVVTPTGKRPKMLPLCARWIRHQTRQPDVWVVSLSEDEDLGDVDLPPYAVVHRWSHATLGSGMTGQIDSNSKYQIEALRQVPPGHAACFFDDDDWYGPTYLETVERDLASGVQLSGNGSERRYSLLLHKWMHIEKSGCNAGATSLAPEAIQDYITWLQHPETKWEAFDHIRVNLRNGAPRVSIKHGPGLGHLFPPADRKWMPDIAKWDTLRRWIGNDVAHYVNLAC